MAKHDLDEKVKTLKLNGAILCLILWSIIWSNISEEASQAWGGAIFVMVLGAASVIAAGKIYYGSRAGMTVAVKSMSDLDTSHAVILTEHTRDDAMAFCRDYERQEPVTETCIRQELSVRINDSIKADCPKGVFTGFYGEKYQFRGKNPRSKEFWSDIHADESPHS